MPIKSTSRKTRKPLLTLSGAPRTRALGKREVPLSPKSLVRPDVKKESLTPSWASAAVFRRAKIIAWAGQVRPLRMEMIYPEEAEFIKSLSLDPTDAGAWSNVIHPIDRLRAIKFFDDITEATLPASIDYRVIDQEGSVVWLRHVVETCEANKSGAKIQGFVEDIQAEKEFQLESLRVSEREQNRIGQDLHDDLCQVLAGLSCLMRVIEGRVVAKAPEEQENLKELNQQIVDAMHRTRALTHGLFPGKIQIADIRGALLELASQVKARFKVQINTQFAGRFPKHSTAQIIQIYRISQEAMSNAIKHGRATDIQVRLEAQADGMELSVRDNGAGFPKSDSATPGVGLNIMKYRANMLGGEISVVDKSPSGVMVRLNYPAETS